VLLTWQALVGATSLPGIGRMRGRCLLTYWPARLPSPNHYAVDLLTTMPDTLTTTEELEAPPAPTMTNEPPTLRHHVPLPER
jgi:hypothetical protein